MHAFFGRMRSWLAGWRPQSELDRVSPEELERIAHDAGVSVGDLRELAARGSSASGLLDARLAALRIDSSELGPNELPLLRDLQRVCSMCASKGRCAFDLKNAPHDPAWESYCPNVRTLRALLPEEQVPVGQGEAR